MPNSASDARGSEREIRKRLVEERAVDAMVSVGPNMFLNVTLPCTLWFLDNGKGRTGRENTVLFIDAKDVFRQIDRAHREWTDEQVGYLANVVRLYREEKVEGFPESLRSTADSLLSEASEASKKRAEIARGLAETWERDFPDGKYADVKGFCKAADIGEIEKQDWSLNAGRYV